MSKQVRILLLSMPGPFQLPIIHGIREGGGKLVAVVESLNYKPRLIRLWRLRIKKLFNNNWPWHAARCLRYTQDANDLSFLKLLRDLRVDLIVVSRWGILDTNVFSELPVQIVNTHVSLLPELRGKNPIPGALLARLRKTGVTIHYLDQGIDTGDIIHQCEFPIQPNDFEKEVAPKAAVLIQKMYAKVIADFCQNNVPRRKQNSNKSFYFSWEKLFGSGPPVPLVIDWRAPARLIHRVIQLRKCIVKWQGMDFKITQSCYDNLDADQNSESGFVIRQNFPSIDVVTGEGVIRLVLSPEEDVGQISKPNKKTLPLAGEVLESNVWPGWKNFAEWADTKQHCDISIEDQIKNFSVDQG